MHLRVVDSPQYRIVGETVHWIVEENIVVE